MEILIHDCEQLSDVTPYDEKGSDTQAAPEHVHPHVQVPQQEFFTVFGPRHLCVGLVVTAFYSVLFCFRSFKVF